MPATPDWVAPFSTRGGAYVLDGVLLIAAAIPVGLIGQATQRVAGGALGTILALIWWAAAIAYMPVFQGLYGQTIGQRITHITVVDEVTGNQIGIGRAVVRYLVLWVSAIPCYIGYFSPLFDSTKRLQGWHDKAANTLVVKGDSTTWPTPLDFLKPAATNSPPPSSLA